VSRLTPGEIQRTAALSVLLACTALGAAQAQDTSLVGLWYAKRYFGPEVRGALIVERSGARWQASIGARIAHVRIARDSVSFDLPSAAKFKGRITNNGASIVGQWIEPQRRIAMPLTLASCGTGCYSGRVQPLDEEFTFYMEVKPRADGKLGAFLRNPERNQGRFIRLDHLVRRGDTVFLRNAGDTTIQTGLLRDGRLSVFLRFNTYDFQKVPAESFTHFYPRGWRTGTYTYAPPRAKNDGWSVARARDVGISEDKLAAMVKMLVNSSRDSANAYRLHGILVARHGKLVLEEYFFGEHADKPHDTRSASKTLVTVVMGAAMQAGIATTAHPTTTPEARTFSPIRTRILTGCARSWDSRCFVIRARRPYTAPSIRFSPARFSREPRDDRSRISRGSSSVHHSRWGATPSCSPP
jgi:hypothetical protein